MTTICVVPDSGVSDLDLAGRLRPERVEDDAAVLDGPDRSIDPWPPRSASPAHHVIGRLLGRHAEREASR